METRPEVIFGEMGLFRMFNVETDGKGGNAMSPVRKPLWGLKKRKMTRGEKAALQSDDLALPLNRVGKPGSQERIAAYADAIASGRMLFETSYADEVVCEENEE